MWVSPQATLLRWAVWSGFFVAGMLGVAGRRDVGEDRTVGLPSG
jgi:hypothetical protein